MSVGGMDMMHATYAAGSLPPCAEALGAWIACPEPSDLRPDGIHSRSSSQQLAKQVAKILIVEDDFLAASEMEAALMEAGFEIAGIANRAVDAVRLAKSESPALAIMDIRLIGRPDGIEAALEIFRETGIRCIFATAHHDARMRARAEAALPLGWLPKPFAPHALVAMVKRALAQL
jgi:DNA-binding NtrC family response regulator